MYKKWLDSGGFSPDNSSATETRSILMPPPNANGLLHIGHAYEVAIQDTLTRYWRMQGYKTLWQPGSDHAGFETQVVFEKKLEKEGRTRFGMDRDALYQEIYEFTQANQGRIREQFERLGASADWGRFRFMLEPEMIATVHKTFKELYDDGLIYRAKRPVHWCVKHQTSLSDLETKDEQRTDTLYLLQYGPLIVATVRPETTFGDVAVAVHPDDKRYRKFVGQTIDVEMADGKTRELPVIADDYVDPEFGTGALKITPAHDPNDFEVAVRHNLPMPEVIDQFGRITNTNSEFDGLKIKEARDKVVAVLESKGLLINQSAYQHAVKTCFKCNSVIEPRIVDQWWLALTKQSQKHGTSLRDMAVNAVKSDETTFVTERFANQFTHWMSVLRDWPLSRQIVWGIRLPVWYGPDGEIVVTDGATPEGDGYVQDPDVFDTWFSSCQWPYTTLGNHGNDLETFYPTTVMAPGYDILLFWVSRMMMLSLYTQGKSPYKTIYLHGLVRDKDRQKMSKSKGNVIDPLGVAEEYGADAIRLSLLWGSAPGTDPIVSDEKIRGMRNFTTKVWNIARYVEGVTKGQVGVEFSVISPADQLIYDSLVELKREYAEAMDQFALHRAAELLYDFVWHDVADTYIEATKEQLAHDEHQASTQANLRFVLKESLLLLHPFIPFVTEAIWQQLFDPTTCLMNQQFSKEEHGLATSR